MSEIHRYQVVKILSERGNVITYSPHGPEVVMAQAHDRRVAELEAELAKAVGLIRRSLGYEKLGPLCSDMEAFLDRHGDKS